MRLLIADTAELLASSVATMFSVSDVLVYERTYRNNSVLQPTDIINFVALFGNSSFSCR